MMLISRALIGHVAAMFRTYDSGRNDSRIFLHVVEFTRDWFTTSTNQTSSDYF